MTDMTKLLEALDDGKTPGTAERFISGADYALVRVGASIYTVEDMAEQERLGRLAAFKRCAEIVREYKQHIFHCPADFDVLAEKIEAES